ncbi:hypothetical protein CCAX7_64970 [Capsulimonas corticalis]|uniref:Uncharacterized protein n=1 Tax=Capsulimonas corticalis TaxID=2219043 RepID=A0A402CQN5_9BACT|nr:hypothetical protein [Capsulimonas corticalis]BDI34446.1 hypothetical protein CCAX7_64970 [Capsulimonas corticalis]
MTHYIIFQRTFAHCITELIQAPSLTEALAAYAVKECGAKICDDDSLIDTTGIIYPHSLAMIESKRKADRKYDELQLDASGGELINHSSWEIRELPSEAWNAPSADIFCSANPDEVSGYIRLCRTEFRKQYPRSRARAFVWHLVDGPLVTFYQARDRDYRRPIKTLKRYLIPWSQWPDVQEYQGPHQDIVDQMHVRFPF